MNEKRLYGWRVSCLLAGGLVLLLLSNPSRALALSSSSASPSGAATGQPVAIAGGSNAATTSQTTVQASQAVATTTEPLSGSQTTTGTDQQTPVVSPDPTPVNTSPGTQDNQTASVTNNINSDSQSGGATVAHNQVGGDATSGAASASATLINTVQTSAGSTSSPWQTFTDNITGNQNGNITVDPTQGSNVTGQGAATTMPATVTTTSSINNYLTLLAGSGNATVENNGIGGNATTGPATADANLINLIDSAINDQQSFLGLINIFGNLTGNILIPQNLVNALTTAPNSSNGGNAASQVTNNFLINNNVTLLANSGQAAVVSNGNGGDATSGNATTNLQLYNLINSQINGGNLLLVFVNVLGTWTGLLFNEPAGTTSAVVGSGIQGSSASSAAPLSTTNTETINNNLYLKAVSGNALVTYNGRGGNATSGNASSSADIVNILGDQVSLSGWFGILIINVFGSWNGSLVAVAPTSPVPPTGTGQTTPPAQPDGSGLATSLKHRLHSFFSGFTTPSSSSSSFTPAIFASGINGHTAAFFTNHALTGSNKLSNTLHDSLLNGISFNILAVAFVVLAIVLFIIERTVTYRQSN